MGTSAQEDEENAQSVSGCRSGAVTAALKSSAAASQAQGAVKKRKAYRFYGSEGVRKAPRVRAAQINNQLARLLH